MPPRADAHGLFARTLAGVKRATGFGQRDARDSLGVVSASGNAVAPSGGDVTSSEPPRSASEAFRAESSGADYQSRLAPDELEPIRRDLAAITGVRHVSVRDSVRLLHSRDCWPRSLLDQRAGELRHPPDIVVWPGSTDEVARVVRYARERRLAITPFGAGSSVVAGTVPLRAGISLDLKRMRRLSRLDLAERRAVVQAGMMGQRLEDELNGRGATLGHFPSSIYCSTVGGWIAARGAGQFSSYYGKIEDMVLSLTAVAGTGEIVTSGPERVPGPDLVQLLTGSEGTLAVVTSATLRIHPIPTAKAVRAFRFRNVQEGLSAMRQLFRAGLRPHLLRLYDPLDSWIVGDNGHRTTPSGSSPLDTARSVLRENGIGYLLTAPGVLNRAADLLPPRCMLVLSFEGDAQARVEAQLQAARDVIRDVGGTDLGEGPALRWYRKRHSTSYKQSGVFAGGGWVDTMEVAGTWDRVQPIYDAVRRAVTNDAFVLCHFSHAYLEGCSLYFTFIGSARTVERGRAGYDRTWAVAIRAAMGAGATLSHHHGVGSHKARYLPDELGVGGMRALRALKASFDPDGILNPGKLLT